MSRAARSSAAMLAALLALGEPSPSPAQQANGEAASVVPVPPAERALRTILAGRPISVAGASLDLEGPCFDAAGNLIFSDTQGGRVLRLDRRGRITTLARLDGLQPGGTAVHRDGRIFIAAADGSGGGAIVAIGADGRGMETIVPKSAGFTPNDLVFDAHDGFYFTDARGNAGDLKGGVYHVSAGGAPVPVLRNLAVANGVALSPDGKTLWVGEYAAGRLHRIDLADPTAAKPFGATVAYHFIGPAPDSMRTDVDGNVYVAMYGQGRILVFAASGLPIGQVLLPGRDNGRNLQLTSMAIQPGTRELYIVASDGPAGPNRTIFRAEAFGAGSAFRAKN